MTTFKDKVLRDAVIELGLNPDTLKPAQEWTQASPDDVRLMLKIAGLTGVQAASLLGLDARTIRKWTGGGASIPFSAWALLVNESGLGLIAKRPVKGVVKQE